MAPPSLLSSGFRVRRARHRGDEATGEKIIRCPPNMPFDPVTVSRATKKFRKTSVSRAPEVWSYEVRLGKNVPQYAFLRDAHGCDKSFRVEVHFINTDHSVVSIRLSERPSVIDDVPLV